MAHTEALREMFRQQDSKGGVKRKLPSYLLRVGQSAKSGDSTKYRGLPIISGEEFVERLLRVPKRPRLVHDIISVDGVHNPAGTDGEFYTPRQAGENIIEKVRRFVEGFCEQGVKRKSREAYKGGFILCSYHEKENFNHVHIIHDCTWSGSTCKCAFRNRLNLRGIRRQYRRNRLSEMSRGFARNIGNYYCLRTEECNYFYTAAEEGCVVRQDGSIQGGHNEDKIEDLSVEGQDILSFLQCEPTRYGEPLMFGKSKKVNSTYGDGSQKPIYGHQKSKIILGLLMNTLVCPPKLICNTSDWLQNDQLLFTDNSDKDFQNALNTYKRLLRTWSVENIVQHYSDPSRKVLFAAVDTPFENKYHNISDSISYMEDFLKYQLRDKFESFIIYLYLFLNRKTGKKNTMILWGPPNCGKSWFISCIKALMINCSSPSIMTANNNFCLSSAPDSNLLVCDELNYDRTTFTETLKLLTAGEDTEVSKKYREEVTVLRTPVIIMSNDQNVIPPGAIFDARCIKLRWGAVKKEYMCKLLHPFAFLDLIKKFNNGSIPGEDICNKALLEFNNTDLM